MVDLFSRDTYEVNLPDGITLLQSEKAKRDRVMDSIDPDWRWKTLRSIIHFARNDHTGGKPCGSISAALEADPNSEASMMPGGLK
jgi:hypothetical protein